MCEKNENIVDQNAKDSTPNARKNIVLGVVVAIAVVALVSLMQRGGICCPVSTTNQTSNTGVTAAAPITVETNKEKKLPLLLEFGAEQCAPCKMMAPIIDELKKEYQGVMDVSFIDVWKKENEAKARKYNIQSIPAQIFYNEDGEELWRHVGFISKKDILAKWLELGYDMGKLARQNGAILISADEKVPFRSGTN